MYNINGCFFTLTVCTGEGVYPSLLCIIMYVFLQAREYAETLGNAVWTNQFDNTANRQAHFETTGPEIWRQTGTTAPGHLYTHACYWILCVLYTDGEVDAVTFGTGTGGTLSGLYVHGHHCTCIC